MCKLVHLIPDVVTNKTQVSNHITLKMIIAIPLYQQFDVTIIRSYLVPHGLPQRNAVLRLNQATADASIILLNVLNCLVKWWVMLTDEDIKRIVPTLAYVVGTIPLIESDLVHAPYVRRKHWRRISRRNCVGNQRTLDVRCNKILE